MRMKRRLTVDLKLPRKSMCLIFRCDSAQLLCENNHRHAPRSVELIAKGHKNTKFHQQASLEDGAKEMWVHLISFSVIQTEIYP